MDAEAFQVRLSATFLLDGSLTKFCEKSAGTAPEKLVARSAFLRFSRCAGAFFLCFVRNFSFFALLLQKLLFVDSATSQITALTI